MYLKKAVFYNRAPFDRMELDFMGEGINVLCAVNGRGKTTILSHIVDAFYEMVRPHYPNSFVGRENTYYRISSPSYKLFPSKASWVYLRFEHEGENIDYFDCQGRISEEEYNGTIPFPDKISYSRIKRTLDESGNIKYVDSECDKKTAEQILREEICTFFPAYRCEAPSYLTDPYEVHINFGKEIKIAGKLSNPLEVRSTLPQISSWIMDVVLDHEVNKGIQYFITPDGSTKKQVSSSEDLLFHNINHLIQQALSAHNYEGRIRLGIGRRNGGAQRIAIMQDHEGKSSIACPSIFSLSSGELALLCLFGEILRQADTLKNNIELGDIKGIVLIDEVEKHLHIKLQYEILPRLFKLFPKVQFIVSSHSPFFNMGLADSLHGKSRIYDLDNKGLAAEPCNNQVFKDCYNLMLNENQRFADRYFELSRELEKLKKTVILTEGKTDIKHIMKAKKMLKIDDVDFECVSEKNQPSGEDDLQRCLEHLSIMPNSSRVIIGIFDCDTSKTEKIRDSKPFKNYGNNVYAFCIQPPEKRKANGETSISIEFLYSDDEIKQNIPQKGDRRLFIGTEFSEESAKHVSNPLWHLSRKDEAGKFKVVENTGKQAVYDGKGNNILATKNDFVDAIVNDQIKVSHESWENFRHIFDTIRDIVEQSSAEEVINTDNIKK